MYLTKGRILIFIVATGLAFLLAGEIWSIIPLESLSIIWPFASVPLAFAGFGFHTLAKYGVFDHRALSNSQFERLNKMLKKRRTHLMAFIVFSFLVTLILAAGGVIAYADTIMVAYWYFKIVVTCLVIDIVLFIYVFLSNTEIDDFETKLVARKRESEERKRLLIKMGVPQEKIE